MEDSAPDWSELHDDILGSVFNLLECPDLLRCAAVCTAWRSVFSDARSLKICPQRQTPCLLYCTEVAGTSAVGMYSLLEKREYTIPLPDPPVSNRTWIGSSHGWLITADEKSDLILLNPITGEQIALPPVTTMEHVKPIFNEDGILDKYEMLYYDGKIPRVEDTPYAFDLPRYHDIVYYKAMLSSDPSSGDCIVVLIHQPYSQISFARVGEDHWNWIPIGIHYSDCIYHEGWFYTVISSGGVDAFKLNGPSVIHKRVLKDVQQRNEKMYIVQSPWGDLLLINRITIIPHDVNPEIEDTEMHTSDIEIYKVDIGEQKLVKLTGIGYNALFLGHNTCCCLPVKDYHMLMPNCVYMTDDDYLWLFGRHERRDVGIYSLKNNSLSNVVSLEPWKSWLPPIWMTPNLVKTGMVQ
uniref:F-box domain-containing protein n=1 Tax=Leersia perrieri TaxID=77586 RepID=A0A0D9WR10_9ORYZ